MDWIGLEGLKGALSYNKHLIQLYNHNINCHWLEPRRPRLRMGDDGPRHTPDAKPPLFTQNYPEIPPPAYHAVYQAQIAPVGPSQPSGLGAHGAFSTMPAVRYDTMTSYVEDGSGLAHNAPTVGAILDKPMLVRCPFCKTTVTTTTQSVTGLLTWLSCLTCMISGCLSVCCLFPFCCGCLKDVQHVCPKCYNVIAVYKRI